MSTGHVPSLAGRKSKVHLGVLAAGGLVVGAWAMALALTLGSAGARPDRHGTLLAVFPRGVAEAEVLARVARADGAVVRGTWFGNVWQVHGERPGFSGRLLERGAVRVLPALPYDVFGVGGCSFGLPPVAGRGGA
ncbi:MAG TPA: hypothetical protein VFY87_12250 [Geminicoccaceae bacterium]|jgi:hypothetical protein|nr:hypothetical protein [Geminicoccaceae bacterium]